MNVDSAKKALVFPAMAVLLILLCSICPAGAADNEPIDRTMNLTQATRAEVDEVVALLGLRIGGHYERERDTEKSDHARATASGGDVYLVQAEEPPFEMPGLEFSLLMAEQTQESAGDQSEASEQAAADEEDEDEYDDDEYDDEYEDEYGDEDEQLISDPLEQGNRDFYGFNDTMYYVVLKPLARGYGFIMPEEVRTCIRNAFYNLRFPIRFVACLLQGKGTKARDEFGRFFLNTTVGMLGLANIAAAETIDIQPSKEDFGQTFAVWGIGQGPYLMVPIFGPYSLRHGVGALIDAFFLDPIVYLVDDFWTRVAIKAGETVNETSLRIGEYETLKEAALDPYVMIRNAYVQNRNKLIAE